MIIFSIAFSKEHKGTALAVLYSSKPVFFAWVNNGNPAEKISFWDYYGATSAINLRQITTVVI
ncbi:MAG TPA: hypothetical protein PLG88_01945 [Chitinophagaceae bacterium]|nr:hypothetical protein [Chitinophagaceae bacterium]HQU56157.1 hypothetical protein [Chitinophagaceae bacterium]